MTEAESYRWAGMILAKLKGPGSKKSQLADRIAAALQEASNLGERMATRSIIRRLAEPALHSN